MQVLILCAFSTSMWAQQGMRHHFTYDAAGNRVKREVIYSFTEDPPAAFKVAQKDSLKMAASTTLMTFRVYPNPNNGQFQVSTDNFKEGAWLELVDMSGKQILQQQITESTTKVDITRAGFGSYVLICRDRTQVLGRWKIVTQ